MTAALRFCRHCDEPITSDPVVVAHEETASGPGRIVWAHREHARLVQPDPQLLHPLLRIRLRKAAQN